MLTAIKQHVIVKKGGIIELSAPELVEGSELEVAAVLSDMVEERDDTGYLESSPETHRQIIQAIRNADEHPEDLITFTPGEWDAQYRL